MYNNGGPIGAAAGTGVLAYTGTNSLWAALAAFALIAAGLAVKRMVPMREQ